MDNKTVLFGVVAIVIILGAFFLLQGNTTDTTTEMNADTTNEMQPAPETTVDTTSDPMMNEDMPETADASEPETIAAAAMNTASLSTLVTAVSAAELVTTLQGEGPFTVFAPTNDAFDGLPAGTLETLLEPANQADLEAVLTYHVVPGEYTAADLEDGMMLTTVNGESLEIGVSAAGVTVNGDAMVMTPDVVTGNGVVHVIDGVLLPPEA